MGSFTKKSNIQKKRARITRRKRRSSRTKYNRHRYKKIGGEHETMSKTIVERFPIMNNFPSCGTCMTAIDNSVSKDNSKMEKNVELSTQDGWDGWSTVELEELGVPKNTLPPSSYKDNNIKSQSSAVKPTVNPYARKRK